MQIKRIPGYDFHHGYATPFSGDKQKSTAELIKNQRIEQTRRKCEVKVSQKCRVKLREKTFFFFFKHPSEGII